jgi:hypothetical protein
MVDLLTRRSSAQLLEKLEGMDSFSEIVAFISSEVESAYKAGCLRLNANDNTIETKEGRKSWSASPSPNLNTGKIAELTKAYLNSKGYAQ